MRVIKCSRCGAPLEPSAKVCPNCGKLVSTQSTVQGRNVRRSSSQGSVRRSNQSKPKSSVRQASISQSNRQNMQIRSAQPIAPPKRKKKKLGAIKYKARQTADRTVERVKSRRGFAIAARAITVAIVVLIVYLAIYFVQVFRVKISDYDFDSEMEMSKDNYGVAISDYFDDGSWSVNPFNATCTYTGESKHDEEYEIVFSVGLTVKVKSISVDGEEIDDELIETKMMGMFI